MDPEREEKRREERESFLWLRAHPSPTCPSGNLLVALGYLLRYQRLPRAAHRRATENSEKSQKKGERESSFAEEEEEEVRVLVRLQVDVWMYQREYYVGYTLISGLSRDIYE